MQAHSYPTVPGSPHPIGEATADAPEVVRSTELSLLTKPTAERSHGLINVWKARGALLAARIAADGLLLIAAFVLAYWLRYGLELGRDVSAPESYMSLPAFYPYIAAYVVGTLLIFRVRGLYALPRRASWLDHMMVITGATVTAVSALTLGALLINTVLPSRLVFISLWLCTIAIFAVERFAFRRLRVRLWRRGINIRETLVVGAGVAAQRIIKDIVERPDLGYTLLGYVSDGVAGPGSAGWRVPISGRYRSGLQRLGGLGDARDIIGARRPQEVIVALPPHQHAQTLEILDSCRELGVEFKLVPDLCEMRFHEVRIDALNGVPLIGIKDVVLQGTNLLVKRIVDVALVLVTLLFAALPMLVIASIIKLTSPGPVLFRQKRVGKDGRIFVCFKFRSMYKDAESRLDEIRHLNEADGPIFKMKEDPRLTPFGKFLRRTSLDELPQLFNILKGDMSWVGPRPPTPDEVKSYSDWQLQRLAVTSGLTGLWQVSGRSNLSFDEMVKLDLYYAENWSMVLDLTIMLRTIPAVLKRSGAY
ncbi:MAG TPA: sugar transferase [Chloroflexia bacterium]|nr:sugar transferase [Chloroflexia bacterium]